MVGNVALALRVVGNVARVNHRLFSWYLVTMGDPETDLCRAHLVYVLTLDGRYVTWVRARITHSRRVNPKGEGWLGRGNTYEGHQMKCKYGIPERIRVGHEEQVLGDQTVSYFIASTGPNTFGLFVDVFVRPLGQYSNGCEVSFENDV